MKLLFQGAILIVFYSLFSCQRKEHSQNQLDKLYNRAISRTGMTNDSLHLFAKNMDTIKLNLHQKVMAHIIIGHSYFTKADYDISFKEFSVSKQLLTTKPNDTLKIKSLTGIASVYLQQGKYDLSLANYYEAEKIARHLKIDFQIGKCLSGIAQVYQIKEDLKTAKEYVLKAIPFLKSDSYYYYNVQLTLANLYGMAGNIDSALYVDDVNLKELNKSNQPVFKSYFYNNKGNCYMYSNRFDSAEVYFNKCLEIDKTTGDKKQIADSYINLTALFILKNDTAKLNWCFNKAIAYCNHVNYLPGKVQLYQGINEYYSQTSNKKKALAIKDSLIVNYKKIYNVRAEEKIAELKVLYEDDKKQEQLKQQTQQIDVQRLIIILIFLLIVLAIVLIWFYIKQQRNKKEQEIKLIKQEQKEIETRAIFESEQNERIRIARDLHDSLGQKLSALKFNLTAIDFNNETILQLVDDTIKETRTISHNLIPEELNFGLISAIEATIEKTTVTNKHINIQLIKPTDLNKLNIPLLKALNVFRVFQELFSNTIKHSEANNIVVELIESEELFIMTLKDNGKGLSQVAIQNSKGIGWKNIKARIGLLKGDLHMTATQEFNTIIKVTFPLQ